MGSSRLPSKVLLPLVGHPMLWHIVQRLRKVKSVSEVVVATTDKEQDNAIVAFCETEGIQCFRGSEADVLDRFYRAAKQAKADHIIRITGDCPMVDTSIVKRLVDNYLNGDYDHFSVAAGAGAARAVSMGRYPDGLDAEILPFHVIEQAWKESSSTAEREHVTPFIWQQPERYRIGRLYSEVDLGSYRFVVDNKEDFELVEWIYNSLYKKNNFFGLQEVLRLIASDPERISVNQLFVGREGYEEFWK